MAINISQDKIEDRDQFMKNLNGTSLQEVLVFSLHLPFFTFLPIFIELCVLNKLKINVYKLTATDGLLTIIVFLIEFISIVVPVILLLTVFANYAHISMLCVVSIIFMRIIYCVSSPSNCVGYWNLTGGKRINLIEDTELLRGKSPFITYFRSLTFLATAISILGVDFHVYPRRFAKTETYGISLMDLGVGMFVMATAIVRKSTPYSYTSKVAKGLQNTLKESAVFLCLGVIRYYFIQRFTYQTHVTEYGVHWNFFITLGLLKPISYIIQLISRDRNLICGLMLALTNQYMISSFFEIYVMSDKPRNFFVDANREGIVSLTGFVCIYLLGCSITVITSFKTSSEQNYECAKLRTLFKMLILSSISVVVTFYCDRYYIRISRRLGNLPYVLCVVTVALVLMTTSLIVELLATYFLPIQPRLRSKIYYLMTPALLESINYNGLFFFLITNVLTGVLNIFIDLYSLETLSSLLILTFYMLSSCIVVFLLYFLRIQVKAKFWL